MNENPSFRHKPLKRGTSDFAAHDYMSVRSGTSIAGIGSWKTVSDGSGVAVATGNNR